MKPWVFVASLLMAATPAAAFVPCHTVGGLSIDQWFNVCGPALRENYAEGYGRGQDWDAYVQAAYGAYLQSPPPAPVPGPMGGGLPNAGMLCAPGAVQCFNHWLRTCQRMPTGGSWWVTSANRCD